MTTDLKESVERAWEKREDLGPTVSGESREAVMDALEMLDRGQARIAEPAEKGWIVHQWLKKAVLLSFRIRPMTRPETQAWDKVPLKFTHWTDEDFARSGIRVVPGARIRHSAYIAPGAIVMPSFINVGAHVGKGTMVDTWATVGSCAQIGADCHLSGGVGIGGVLEPLQAEPVIIEDGCFIGARSEVVEGVIVERGSVLSMGVFIGASTRIYDRASGETFYGRVPAYSVVVPGAMPGKNGGPSLYCAVIVKRVDEKTRAKTSINDLLRD
ncbi:MAG TPA: 2,3,4,5-tetrahydropyridine-2,6-dicarboxylate N-succinyltransferase [Dongiaceae bacterium]|jgi:2,3,4,5-tetrahydropyridine-2-carboxylate N-succinyltransferase|nr:2,3,4,5-tetrahydropyridine-2,6-dicarboxylate N-succinyltransferase [Dongiaceae bacterium]